MDQAAGKNDEQEGRNKNTVLILCSGNSCRSQIAEALVNAHLADSWQAWSAGTEPAGYVHQLAITVLKEIGIKHLGQSKSILELPQKDFDLVITVCDPAAENCPAWLGRGKRVHISFPDPARAGGSKEERLSAFRSVRDDIASRLIGYLESYTSHNGDQARSSDE